MSKLRLAGQVVIPFVILGIGGAGMMAIVKSGERGDRKKRDVPPPMVETVPVKLERRHVSVQAMGRVQSAQEVIIRSEVAGVVEDQHDSLSVGARLKADEVLVKIDTRDYALALSQQRSNVARAAMEVKLEKGRRNVAEHEWKLLDKPQGGDAQTKDLVLRKPQAKSAKANLQAAKSGLERAKIALEKTTITVPFDAMVVAESVEKGQLVGPSVPLVTLVGTKRFHVTTSVPVDRLASLRVPGINASEGEGSKATVTHIAPGGVRIVRKANVLRLMGALEVQGNMAQLLLEIEDPLKVDLKKPEQSLPVLLGMRVEVAIQGVALENVALVPREGLRMGRKVWVVDSKETLKHKDVDVVWRDRDSVWLRGLGEGERVIVSPLSTPVDGLKVQATNGAEVPSS